MKIQFEPNIKWIPYGRDSAYNRYFRCEKKNSEYFGKPWAGVAKMRISNNGI